MILKEIHREPTERHMKCLIRENATSNTDRQNRNDEDDRLLSVPVRVRVTPLGDIVRDDTRDRMLSLEAELIVRELKAEEEEPLDESQHRVLVDTRRGIITREL